MASLAVDEPALPGDGVSSSASTRSASSTLASGCAGGKVVSADGATWGITSLEQARAAQARRAAPRHDVLSSRPSLLGRPPQHVARTTSTPVPAEGEPHARAHPAPPLSSLTRPSRRPVRRCSRRRWCRTRCTSRPSRWPSPWRPTSASRSPVAVLSAAKFLTLLATLFGIASPGQRK